MRMHVTRACLVTLIYATASAAPTNTKFSAYKEAGKSFSALVASAESGAKLRQLKNPAFMQLVDAISDDRILGSTPYTASDLQTIMEICGVANKATTSLMLFDLKAHIDPNRAPQETNEKILLLVMNNTLAFQEELTKLQPFLFRCLARQIPPVTELIFSLKPVELTTVRRQGLAQMRSGIVQAYTIALGVATEPRCNKEYREALLTTFAATAGSFASIMQVSDRKRIADSLKGASLAAQEPYKVLLLKISADFNQRGCEGLCKIE
jgi:hypothetical protein